MERHLHGINGGRRTDNLAQKPMEDVVTLRQLANEQQSDDGVDYFLHKKLGASAYFLAVSRFYGIAQFDEPADEFEQVEGGLIVRYAGLQQIVVEHHKTRRHHLAIAEEEVRQLACFETIDMNTRQMDRLRHHDISIGMIMPWIGVELDQDVTIKTWNEVVAVDADMNRRPTLRLVES